MQLTDCGYLYLIIKYDCSYLIIDQHEKTWHPIFLHFNNKSHNTPYMKTDRNTLVML